MKTYWFVDDNGSIHPIYTHIENHRVRIDWDTNTVYQLSGDGEIIHTTGLWASLVELAKVVEPS